MQQCNYCKARFSWAKVFVSLNVAYKPIKCNVCGSEHRITTFSRLFLSLFIVVPIGIFTYFVNIKSSLSISNAIIIMIVYSVIFILLLPFLVKYRSVE
ncbi:TIGR04104 family putative zinc finger protein [Halobacillus karajensis]|uniref:TIGR04104 family putative zinc finger protein n=1 Tax=Halobacillus karajensis TaxID=195088 RepID=UPI0009F48934